MRILLIDLASVWWRNASIAIPSGDMSRKDGDPIQMTMSQIEDVAPDYDGVAVAIDGPPYWRSQEYPDYKGQRPDRDPGIVELYKALGRRIKEKWPILYCKGYEADDLIATAALKLSMADAKATIVTADKDLYQCLIEGEVDVLNVATPPGKEPIWTEARLREEHGLAPKQWALYLALMGDTSDNLPGVKGIGEKTAKKILTDSKAFLPKAINADHMTPKQWEALLATQPDLTLQHRLTTLCTDAPIDVLGKLNMAAREQPEGEPVSDTIPPPEPTQPSEREPDEPDIAAMGGPVSGSLDGALLEAQRLVRSVRKGSRNRHQGFDYASSEDVIREARNVLLNCGVTAFRESWRLEYRPGRWVMPGTNKRPEPITMDGVWMGILRMRVSHPASAEARHVEAEYPVVPTAGRPLDKATSAGLTTCTGYWYLGLLKIPRGDEVDAHEYYEPEGEQPQQKRWNDHRRT